MGVTSTPPTDEGSIGSGLAECPTLRDAATPDVFLKNAFRITGLPVDVTTRDIAKQLAQRKLRAELGEVEDVRSSPFAREPQPSIQEIREAEQKLRNPEQRVVDELFWFWPLDPRGGKSDPALHALAAGDTSTAEQLWKTMESNPDKGPIAIHNVAVRWHLTALSLERHWNSNKADDKTRETLTKCWLYALKRWDQLITDNAFWAILATRVKALDDPRITTAFVAGMRATLPTALASINVALTLNHVENNENDLVVMHVRIMRDSRLVLAGPEEFSAMVLARAKGQIRHHIQVAQQHLQTSPTTAIEAAKELVGILVRYAKLFSVLGFANNSSANDILDEGAAVCMNCAVRANKHTGDDAAFVDVFGRILEVAKSPATRERAQKNLEAGRNALLGVMLEPIYRALVSVRDSTETPITRLEAFDKSVAPLLSKVLADLPASEEARSTIADAAAQVLRDISIDAWNKTKDGTTAMAAVKRAMQYASGEEIKAKLYDDFTALNRLTEERKTIERKKTFKVLAGIGGGILFLLWISGVFDGSKPPSQTTSGSAQTNTGLPPAADQSVGMPSTPAASAEDHVQRSYRVPSSANAELERDSAAIEVQKSLAHQLENQFNEAKSALADKKARADALERELDALKEQIDQAQPYVDNSDSTSVANFNSRVDRYNGLLRQVREQRRSANALVEPFNDLVDKVNAQNHLVNEMVDAYNAKLSRAGH
jgi:hypothetical protein